MRSIVLRPYHSLLRAALAASVLVAGSVAVAADMADHAKSLSVAPKDSAFYVSWVKNQEQIEAIANSNAWKKFMSIPVVQMGWMQAQTQWQFPTQPELVAFKNWFDSEEGQDVFGLSKEMFAEEFFVYGDGSVTTLLQVLMDMNSEMSRAQFQALQQFGGPDAVDEDEITKENVIKLLDKYSDDLEVPNLVAGFVIQDKARASRVLDIAENRLRDLLESEDDVPAWVLESLERRQVNGNELLTFTVTGDMLPWDEIETELADSPELFKKIQSLMEDKKWVLAMGIVDNYMLMTMTGSLDFFENFGQGSDSLADTKEFKRLSEHADKNVITMAYASGDFMKALASQEQSFGDLAVMGKALLSMANLTEEQQESIDKDIDELKDDILHYLPEPGAVAATTFTTDRGYETFTYNWGEQPSTMDGSKKLTLIDHMGEDSLGWFVARGKQSPEGYEKFVEWCKRGMADFEMVAEQQSSESDWQEYEAVRDQVLPLLKQLDEANRKFLIPGFADGQSAIVFDASVADEAWCDLMPASEKELPLPTIALVSGVSDAGAVREGAKVYYDVIQQAIDKAHQASPDDVPKFVLPVPADSTTSAGTIYSYGLPGEWGVNDRIAPNAGLSDSVLVLSVLPELSEKLMAGSTPKLDGPAADFDRPLLSAGHFKFAAFLEACKPWMDYGIQVAIEQSGEDGGGTVAMIGMVKPQVDQVIEVLQAVDSYTGVTYRDGDCWVSHGEMRIIDLED